MSYVADVCYFMTKFKEFYNSKRSFLFTLVSVVVSVQGISI